MKEKKIQWHPGFVAAMELEFAENKQDLAYEKEYNLNTKPLAVDLLIIKKEPKVRISNEIGQIFRGHNLMEYKAPGDVLDIDTFHKSLAYASLYKSYGNTVDERKSEDITISILREAKPRELFRYLTEHGFTVTTPYNGIYYIAGPLLFQTQIVVTKELERQSHVWLKSLSNSLKKQDLETLLLQISNLHGKEEKEMADSVLKVSVNANKSVMEEWLGDENMYDALLELMEPRLQEQYKKIRDAAMREGERKGQRIGKRKGERNAIRGAVDILQDLGLEESEIKTRIMKKYQLTEQEAKQYFQ